MRVLAVLRLVSLLIFLFSFTLLPPMLLSFYFHDGALKVFLWSFLLAFGLGGMAYLLTFKRREELKTRDGFFVVVLLWLILSLFGALPFVLDNHSTMGFLDGFFESVSGWTTTGATVISGIEFLPPSLIYYRQQLQFLGGMGIIVLAVAILPMLGVGGMQLYQAETPGPMKDHKLTPRIAETAKALWAIYAGMTLLCALAYWLAGMSWFNAIGEAFSTVSTGGFSMHDDSFAYYQSHSIQVIAVIFMILSSINYGLHYMALRRGQVEAYGHDLECRSFVFALVVVSVIVVTGLLHAEHYASDSLAFLHGVFNAVSLMTTTGLTSTDYQSWPEYLPILLMFAGLVGGCAASTSGGIKVIRVLLLERQVLMAMRSLIHPKGVYTMRIGGKAVSDEVMQSICAFVFVFVFLFFFLLLLLIVSGLDFKTAFGCLVACLANVGLGIGNTLPSFAHLGDASKMILIFAMLAGRLEIFTLLVLFIPDFWQK